MDEAIQTWSTTRIRERLRILSQRRAAANLEKEALTTRRFPDDPAEPRRPAPPPASRAAAPAPGPEGSDPAWARRYVTDVSLEDVLEGLSRPLPAAGEAPGAPGADDSIGIPVAELLGALPVEHSGARAPSEPAPAPTPAFAPQGNRRRLMLQLTTHRSRLPDPMSRREAAQRMADLVDELVDLDGRISNLQRVLVRRSKNGNVRELTMILEALEQALPQKWASQMLFNVEQFVRDHSEPIRRARFLADVCGETFPSRERDFLKLSPVVRERLFRRLLTL